MLDCVRRGYLTDETLCALQQRVYRCPSQINFHFFSIRVHVHYVHWIHEIAEANSSMYPSYNLNLDLVREATGVHWEEFLVETCRPGTPSLMLKHTFAFQGMQISLSVSESLSELWFRLRG